MQKQLSHGPYTPLRGANRRPLIGCHGGARWRAGESPGGCYGAGGSCSCAAASWTARSRIAAASQAFSETPSRRAAAWAASYVAGSSRTVTVDGDSYTCTCRAAHHPACVHRAATWLRKAEAAGLRVLGVKGAASKGRVTRPTPPAADDALAAAA